MNAATMKSYKDRSVEKHREIQRAIRKLEQEFIQVNSPYNVGDLYKLGQGKVKTKMVDITGVVESISVDYDVSNNPALRINIYSNEPDSRYIKTVYLHVD